MIRQAAAVVVVLLLSPSWVTAQGTELTVNVASASVHKSPTNTSPTLASLDAAPGSSHARSWRLGQGRISAAADGVEPCESMGTITTPSPPERRSRAPRRARTRSQRNRRRAWRHRQRPSKPRPEIACRVRTAAPQRGTASHMFGLGAHLGGPRSASAAAPAHGRTAGSASSSSSRDTRSRVQSISER